MTNKTKPLIFAMLIATMVIGIQGIGDVFAESELQRIEKLGNEAVKIHEEMQETTDQKSLEKLEERLNEIIAEMEKLGVPTIEKYESDPEYWTKVQIEKFDSSGTDDVVALGSSAPDFKLGYAHDFLTYFVWHEWNSSWSTIPENSSDLQTIDLVEDHDWIEAKWQIRGTNMAVTHTYIYTLKDGGTTKQSDTDEFFSIHNGVDIIVTPQMDRYDDSPQEGWTITAQWGVTDIT